jgi:hypothetical protein
MEKVYRRSALGARRSEEPNIDALDCEELGRRGRSTVGSGDTREEVRVPPRHGVAHCCANSIVPHEPCPGQARQNENLGVEPDAPS